jgi:hypothetical protein
LAGPLPPIPTWQPEQKKSKTLPGRRSAIGKKEKKKRVAHRKSSRGKKKKKRR